MGFNLTKLQARATALEQGSCLQLMENLLGLNCLWIDLSIMRQLKNQSLMKNSECGTGEKISIVSGKVVAIEPYLPFSMA